MKKTFVIGDVHGCFDELKALMYQLGENGLRLDVDVVVLVGDLIDRGPDSKRVIEYCMKMTKKYPDNFIVLTGNHELMLFDGLSNAYHYRHWLSQGGEQTLMSYSGALFHNHIEWLRKRPVYYENEEYFIVHGGVIPGVSLAEQKRLIDENNQDIINAVTWARETFINSTYQWEKKIIFGHTADGRGQYNAEKLPFRPIVMANKIGIDTAPTSPKGGLTAIELPGEKIYFQKSFSDYEFIKRWLPKIKEIRNG